MVKKDYKELSNSDLHISKMNLENEFEGVKGKINVLYGELEEIEKEYALLIQEINNRKNYI